MSNRYLGPVLAFLAAVVGAIGDTHNEDGITLLGWTAILLACIGAAGSVYTIRSQGHELRIHAEAWQRDLEAAVHGLLKVIDYLDFAARQNALIVAELGSDRLAGSHVVRGAPNGWARLPLPEDRTDPKRLECLRKYRVDPARGIGGPWAWPVPFGTDRRTLPVLVSEETRLGISRLREVQDLYRGPGKAAAANLISEVTQNAFLKYLIQLPEFLAMRAEMEESRWPDVRLMSGLGSHMGAPPEESFVQVVKALESLKSMTAEPAKRKSRSASTVHATRPSRNEPA